MCTIPQFQSTRIFGSLILILTLLSNSVFAQYKDVKITGKVLIANTDQPIEFATVMVGDKQTDEVLTGTTAGVDGTFSVNTTSNNFFVEISFIGFETKRINDITIANDKADLGTISLSENSKQLDEVVVRGEKSTTEFSLDKRVFNVGKDLSTTGASAYDVLNNVPSVNVNIEGQISLRGSTGVQVLINGKPSVLASEEGNALGTITAEMIERVEVITNPSAKYDAEGTSGIINIVIKKEERKGMNGSISINAGTPHNHSIGLSLNRRTEKFNLFSQVGVGYRELPNKLRNINGNTTDNSQIYSAGTQYRNELYYNFVLGTDYHINDLNVLTVSGNFSYEIEDQPSNTFFQTTEGQVVTSEWERSESTEATNPKIQYEVNYKKEFDKENEDHALIVSALGNFFGKDQSSQFMNETLMGDNQYEGIQNTRTNFQEGRYTFKLDYTKPFNEMFTLETGGQFVTNDVSNDYEVSNVSNGVDVVDPDLTNVFEYQQAVLAAYGTVAHEGEKWGYKLGLRMENTALDTRLINTNETNDQNYTNFFPTFHTSYKVSEKYSVQAGYSRRIYRPRLWDLNPFFNIRNSFSIWAGNPDLQPQFTDSYEISNIYDLEKISMSFSVYHRYTTDVIERILIGYTTSPYNIGTRRSTGLEFNGKYSPSEWMTVNGDFNYFTFNRDGTLESQSFDFSADQWSTKITSKFKLPSNIDFEVTGRYQSSVQTVQGTRSDNVFADLGLRKKIMKGKGVISGSVRDVFASRKNISEGTQGDTYFYRFRQRGRFVTVGFSYGFGKGEAMQYSGQRRR